MRAIKPTPKLQAKLKIGSNHSRFEKQADVVADSVMTMADQPLQMQPSEEEEQLQMQPSEEEEELQMKHKHPASVQMAPNGTSVVKPGHTSNNVAKKITGLKGNGQKMPTKVTREMSQKIGADFSDVTIHKGKEAAFLNKEIGARAFTSGKDIYFNSGEYNPASSEGKHLLAHELTHVVQQTGKNNSVSGLSSKLLQKYPEPDSSNFWELLRHDAVTYANYLVSNNDRAINQLARDLTGQENTSPSGSIAIDLVDFSMDLANASPASKLGFKLLQRIYDTATQVRSGTMEFATFSRTVADATQQLQNSIPNDWNDVDDSSPDVFIEIKNLMENENDSNRVSVRNNAIQLLRDANDGIPGYRTIIQKLVQAWVGGAEDQTLREWTIDLPDPEGFNTGYLRIYVNIRVDSRLNYMSHSFNAISLDDIDLPDGTKQAIITGWGEDFYLDELPFPGIIHLNMGSTMVILEKTSNESTDDLEGWQARVVNVDDRFAETTIQNRKDLYFERIRPQVRHLNSD